jgi:hypothetical protein
VPSLGSATISVLAEPLPTHTHTIIMCSCQGLHRYGAAIAHLAVKSLIFAAGKAKRLNRVREHALGGGLAELIPVRIAVSLIPSMRRARRRHDGQARSRQLRPESWLALLMLVFGFGLFRL